MFDRDHELGEVRVADDPSELLLATSMLAAVQRLRMSRAGAAGRPRLSSSPQIAPQELLELVELVDDR